MEIKNLQVEINGKVIDFEDTIELVEMGENVGMQDVLEPIVERLQDVLGLNHLGILRTIVVDSEGNPS